MEVVAIVVLGVVVLVVGIRMGMLVAPRVERMADRLDRETPTAPAEGGSPEPHAAPPTIDQPPATDEGEG